MAGTSTLSKHFGLRIPIDLWGRLESRAAERGVSVAAILLEPWEAKPKIGRPTKPADKPKPLVAAVVPIAGTDYGSREVRQRDISKKTGRKS